MKILISVLWICLVAVLSYLPEQKDFLKIALPYTLLFLLYLFSYRYFRSHRDILFLLFLSIVLRCIPILAFPNLSDDIYRFLWDGYLLLEGTNPFLHTPTEWMATAPSLPIFAELYPLLNSPDYHSIYPPVCQVLFGLTTWLCGSNIYFGSIFLKLIFVAAEAGTIYTLMKFVQQLGLPLKRVLLYALNPLIIIELSGNLHFEAIMIFFLITGLWLYARKRYLGFGVLMGLSILTKLLPLMFLPFFIRRTPILTLVRAFLVIGITILIGFVPFYDPIIIEKFGSSLDLYFRKFEFNASFYYLAREVGYWYRGFNMIATIGPWLSVITFLMISLMALFERNASIQSLIKYCLLAMTSYLLLATTVHPWYISLPVVLCIFTRFRYPLFWSGLITLTYINYWGGSYHERMGIVILEYAIVLILLYLELFRVPMVKALTLKFLKFFQRLRPNSSPKSTES